MAAIDWFEGILAEGERIEKIKQNLAMLESRIAPRSQGYEPMGHGGGSSDRMLASAMLSSASSAWNELRSIPTREGGK